MRIIYKATDNSVNIDVLSTGDVFLYEKDAFMVLDQERITMTINSILCARLDNGMICKFSDIDPVIPMTNSLIEINK